MQVAGHIQLHELGWLVYTNNETKQEFAAPKSLYHFNGDWVGQWRIYHEYHIQYNLAPLAATHRFCAKRLLVLEA